MLQLSFLEIICIESIISRQHLKELKKIFNFFEFSFKS